MDMRFLQTLLDVVEGGSLAEAARRQNLTPAAVGQRLRALEADLGVPLVRRSGPTVRPTAACLRILPRLRAILSETALLASDLAEDGLAGTYRLGVISTALADHIPALVTHLQDAAPKVDLVITPGASAHLFNLLTCGELDAAILVAPSFVLPKRLTTTVLDHQPFAWITPSDAPAGDLPLILYDRTSWGGEIAWNWIDRTLPAPDILCEMDAPETVAALVASEAGRAVLPVWAGLTKMAGIQIAPIEDLTKRPLVMAHAGSPIDTVCADFLSL